MPRPLRRPPLGLERLCDRVVPDATFTKLFTVEHADLAADYFPGTGWEVSTEIGSDDPADSAIDYPPATTLHYVAPAAAEARPAGAAWDFIGVPAGATFYRLPQAQNAQLLYLGTASEETPFGTLTRYRETDTRVNTTVAQPWVTAEVLGVRGPGQFAVWQPGSFGAQRVFVSTAQGGIDATDRFYFTEGGHVHYNYGFTAPGFYEVDVRASALVGGVRNFSPVHTFYFTVASVLQVTSVTPTASGFLARFNRPIDAAALNLYGPSDGSLGPADVTLVGPDGPVRGSLVVPIGSKPDEATGQPTRVRGLNAVEFVRTGGPLPAGTYTVTLRSGSAAYAGSTGFRTTASPADTSTLDGNGDGTSGDDYTTTFTVAADPPRAVGVADFARGAGQAVNLPATAAGLPVAISDADGVTRVQFDLTYDPALLSVTAAARGPQVPATFGVTFTAVAPGRVQVLLAGPTALPAGRLTLVTLTATVPNNAPYGDKQVIGVEGLSVNDGAVAARGDRAVHAAGYIGDVTADRVYSALDAGLMTQVGLGLGTGFRAYRNLDPVVVGGVSGGTQITSLDTGLVTRQGVGLAVPQIPDVPALGTPPPTGADPRLYFVSAAGRPGETVTVRVRLNVNAPGGVELAALDQAIRFDPTRFRVSNVRAGALVPGFRTVANVDNVAGTIRVGQSTGGRPLALPDGADGEVLLLDVTVLAGARPGRSPLNLAKAVGSNGSVTTTGASDLDGGLVMVPAPTDGAYDRGVDGVFVVLPGDDRAAPAGPPSPGGPASPGGGRGWWVPAYLPPDEPGKKRPW